MNPGICDDEIQDCAVNSLSDSMLWRKLLRKVGNCLSLNISGTIITSPPSGNAIIESRTDTAGFTIAAGSDNVVIETSDDFTGNINGQPRFGSRIYKFNHSQGKLLPAIVITRTAGTIYSDITT